MADENYKLTKFQAAVFAEVDMKTVQIKQEAELLKEKELEHNKDLQLDKSYNYIQKKSSDIKKQYKREVARFSLDKKRELLIRRGEITDRVLGNVAQMLQKYIETVEYKAFLLSKIAEFVKNNDVENSTIELSPSDTTFKDEITKIIPSNLTIATNESIKLGGFIVCNYATGVYYDETLQQRLNDQKAYFMKHSQLAV